MWFFKGQKKELDPERTYLRIQFMTPEEKTNKQLALKHLQKQYQDDEQSIVPYENAFPVSFRLILNTTTISGTAEPIKDKMLIKELLCHLEVTKNQQLQGFMHTYVKDIQIFIMNEEMLSRNEVVPLYSQIQATVYTPSQVLEIIYEPRSLWERIKRKAKAVVKDIPGTIAGIMKRLVFFLFGLIGLDGAAKSVVMKMVPTRAILQYLLSIIAMFFPMLSPLIAMGSKMILG